MYGTNKQCCFPCSQHLLVQKVTVHSISQSVTFRLERHGIYMIMVQPTSFAFFFFCVFVSAYHRLFNLVVDGHNASTRGTAEERKKKHGAINKQLIATTADQLNPSVINKRNILVLLELCGGETKRFQNRKENWFLVCDRVVFFPKNVWSAIKAFI